MRRSPRRFVTALTVLASLILFIGSLVANEHVTAQGPTQDKQDCEDAKKHILELEETLQEQSATLGRLEQTADEIAAKLQKAIDTYKKWLKSTSYAILGETPREVILNKLAKASETLRVLRAAIEDTKQEIQKTKEEIDALLKRLGTCGAKTIPTPKPTPSPTPSPTPKSTGNQVGYHVGTNTANGLFVTTFDTPQGKIKVNLPDDMAAGDTISGTVECEPSGKNDVERAQNQSELNGEVIEVGGQKTKVGDKRFSWLIHTALDSDAKTIMLLRNNQTVATSEIPIANTPPPTPTQFTLPTGGQQGRPVEIKGPCNGAFSPQDSVKIGGTTAPPLAESPRKIVVQDASNNVGPTNIECKENGTTTQCPFRNIGIKLSAPKLNLRRGETTTLHVVVSGLSGFTQTVPLDVEVNTPNIINMSGGPVQHREINPTLVQQDGTAAFDFTLTGIMAGGFGVTGTVIWTETYNVGPGGVIAGGPGPISQPPPSPTPLTPTDTASGEVCKWIAYKTYRVDEWKREQSNDKDLEVRHGSAKGGGVTVEFHCKAAGTFTFTVTKESGSPDVVSVTCTQP